MAGMFDDLVPQQQGQAPAAASGQQGMFDDLVPQAAQAEHRSAIEQLLGVNGPRYQLWPERAVRGMAEGAALPHDVMQEAQQPKPTISDSDLPAMSVPNVLNLAGMASPLSVAAKSGEPLIATAEQAVPSQVQLKSAATAAYEHPSVTDLRLNPSVGSAMVDKIKTELIKNKLDPINAPNVLGTVGNIGKARFEAPTTDSQTVLAGPGYHIAEDVAKPAPLQIADLDLARQSLSGVPFEQKRAAGIARKVIDDYLGGNIPAKDVVGGDAAAANAKLLEARGNYSASMRDKEITDALGRAENQAGSTYSGGNLENATRQQLRPILNGKEGVAKTRAVFQDYTPEEIAALKAAVNGSRTGNAVRSASKLLGAGHGVGASAIGMGAYASAEHAGLDPIMSAIVGLGAAGSGKALNMWGAALANSRARAVSDMLRSRSPLAQQMQPVMVPPNPLMSRAAVGQLPNVMGFGFGRPILGMMPAPADQQQ